MRTPLALSIALSLALVSACGPDYPACDTDEDCHEAEFCVDGQCQQCRSNTDCPTGQQCSDGRCDPIPGYCDAEHPCPAGQSCENNRCVAPTAETECDGSNPCPAGQRCESGRCIAASTGEPVCALASVYFDYNSDALDERDRDALTENATCVRDRHATNVHVTGYADERGTEEYNMALGDRRARAAAHFLETLGLGSATLTISSMGEEAATGTDEAAWQHDRRADVHAR
jgi:peptidoglycan-associated lipoprotein